MLFTHHPCNKPVSQLWGLRPEVYQQYDLLGHNGIDFSCPGGTPIVSVANGVVREVGYEDGGYGKYIKVVQPWGETVYAHLSRIDVSTNQVVAGGKVLGLSGNTGNSSGPHLHFGLRINPYDRKDGWGGHSNPLPYLQWAGRKLPPLLGPHLHSGIGGLDELLVRWQPRVALLFQPSYEHAKRLRNLCPDTMVIGRIYEDDNTVAEHIKADPVEAATWIHRLIMQHPARTAVDVWHVANEVCQSSWEDYLKLNTCMMTWMKLATGTYRCGIFTFSVGNPDLPVKDRMGWWRPLFPTLDYAEEHHHVLLLHQYGAGKDIFGPPEKGNASWMIKRWQEQVRPLLAQRELEVAITETGYDGLITGPKPAGWQTAFSPESYVDQLVQLNQDLKPYHGQIRGACIYTWGQSDLWPTYDINPIVPSLIGRLTSTIPIIPEEPVSLTTRRLSSAFETSHVTILPFDKRQDFDIAKMRADTVIYQFVDGFTSLKGNWDNQGSVWDVPAWARKDYLFPPDHPLNLPSGGGDHNIFVRVDRGRESPVKGRGILWTSDGPENLQPPKSGKVTLRDADTNGWNDLPIYGPDSSFVPERGETGPWSVSCMPFSDIVTGMGLPANEHVSWFLVFRETTWGAYQKDVPVVFNSLDETLKGRAEKSDVLPVAEANYLTKVILAENLAGHIIWPTGDEFKFDWEGKKYIARRARNPLNKIVYVYYCLEGKYDQSWRLQYEV